MKYLIFLILFTSFNCSKGANSNSDLKFQLVVPQKTWKAPKGKKAFPILMLWKVTNTSKHDVILPIGTQAEINLTDKNGKLIRSGTASTIVTGFSYSDYRRILPGWSTYFTVGDLSLCYENKKLFIAGGTAHAAWTQCGPLILGSYKLKCIFLTDETSHDYGPKVWGKSNLWLGKFTSKTINITIEK